jgi:hypothetical protein
LAPSPGDQLPPPDPIFRSIGQNAGRGLAGTFEVFHEHPLKFDGYQFPRAKIPAAKKNYPD